MKQAKWYHQLLANRYNAITRQAFDEGQEWASDTWTRSNITLSEVIAESFKAVEQTRTRKQRIRQLAFHDGVLAYAGLMADEYGLGKLECKAYQASDQMTCKCGLKWDMNDEDPPTCNYDLNYTLSECYNPNRKCRTLRPRANN